MRRLLLMIIIGLMSFSLFGLDITDPLGMIYQDIQVWYENDLIDHIPSMRPYPAQVVVDALQQVADGPDTPEFERERALYYLSKLNQKISIDGVWFGQAQLKGSDDFLVGGAGIEYNGWLTDNISWNGRWVALGKDAGMDGYYAAGEAAWFDTFDDSADLTVKGRAIDLRQMFTNSIAFGTEDLYLQAGIHRNSYGPIFDNGAVMGGYASHAPTFTFVWDDGGFFGVTTTYMELTASNYYGQKQFPDKRLAMQSYKLRPLPWMELEALQSVVYGDRFDLLYFVPFSFLFYNQNFAGFDDNTWLGGSMSLDLPYNMAFNSLVYLDDAHFNKMIRGDFSGKLKASIHNEFSWSPMNLAMRRISLDYLAVTPYTYSHQDLRFGYEADQAKADGVYVEWLEENANYLNYSHYNDNLGPVLDPNSDRLTFKFHTRPFVSHREILDLNIIGRMIRHGNPYDNGGYTSTDGTITDGTIYDDGFDDPGDQTFKDENRFLTQDVLEYTYTAGADAIYTVIFDPHRIKFLLGYRFEQILNKRGSDGSPVDGNDERNHYLMGGFAYSYAF